jgi:phage protein D
MAANPHFAPEMRLAIGGQPIPAGMRASVTRLSLQQSLGASDRTEFTLHNEGLRWLDHPLLALDRELTVAVGYAPDPLSQLFAGEVVSLDAAFPSGSAPTLTVVGQDRLRRLQEGTNARSFAIPIPKVGQIPIPDSAVVDLVALEHGLVPLLEPVGAAISTLLGGAALLVAGNDREALQSLVRRQQRESDFDFLAKVARENGWDLTIDQSGPLAGIQLRFRSPLDHLAPDIELIYGRSLLEFRPRISNVGQIVSVTAFVWVAQIKTSFAVTIGWDWDRMALSIDVQASYSPSQKGPSDVTVDEPITLLSAPRKLLGELIPKLNGRLTGSGSCVGDPLITAGAVLKLSGIGVQFGGLYRVTSATHTLDQSGYRTKFEVRKEIWFGSIPAAQQGAIPVRLTPQLSGGVR